MTKGKTWKAIFYISVLAVSLFVLPTIYIAIAQSPDPSKNIQQIRPEELGKSPLTTQPKAGEIAVTTNVVELKEEATGEIKLKAGTPKSFVKAAAEAKNMVVQEFKTLATPLLEQLKGKPIQVDIINDQKGTVQKFELKNLDDPKFQNALSDALNPPGPPP